MYLQVIYNHSIIYTHRKR